MEKATDNKHLIAPNKLNMNYATFKDWFLANFDHSEINDIVKYGVDTGSSGIIYTNECEIIFDQFSEEIWEMAREDAEIYGYKSALEMIENFNRVDMAYSFSGFKKLLVWFACERTANEVINELKDEDELEEE